MVHWVDWVDLGLIKGSGRFCRLAQIEDAGLKEKQSAAVCISLV